MLPAMFNQALQKSMGQLSSRNDPQYVTCLQKYDDC